MASLLLPPLSMYYCYNPVDRAFCQALDVHLSPLKRKGWIETWDDQQIPAGQEWKREQEAHLSTAHLLVLLVSADFLASEAGTHLIEVALQRQQAGEAIVIPILVRSANWEETDLQILHLLPREQKAITTWPDQDAIWREVARDVQRVVETMRQWVFVVSSPEDQGFVQRLQQDMIPSGVLLWSLEEGQDEETRRNAMRAACAVLLVASPDASPSRLVKAQLTLATTYRRPILVVWARGEDWGMCNPGNWSVREVLDMREQCYEVARKALLMRLRQEVVTFPSLVGEPHAEPRNPYKGLHAFTRDDARDFFGREAFVEELASTIATMLTLEQKRNQHERLLAVIGPSGSGKSSLVMAGLLPHLQTGAILDSAEWNYLDPMYPGTHPLESLAVALAPQFPARSVRALHEDFASDSVRVLHLLACQLTRASEKKVVLVVDQFEELFTLTTSAEERQHFLDLLVTAATEPSGPLLILLMLRADFYDRSMQYPDVHRLIDAHYLSVFPMESEDLRRVIEQPAHLPGVQLTFEGDLVGDLLFEIRGQPGALPLLQFTLDQLFQHRDGHLLTLQAYQQIGRVKGALSQHAERTYQELPSPQHQTMARALFVRLIEPGMTEQDTTRRRAVLSEFDLVEATEKQQMQETLEAFIRARLLTTSQSHDRTTVEVSHEAVIREWKRLAEWLSEAREDIHFQQSLSEDVTEWNQRKQPRDRLYRGVQLKEARDWARRNKPSEQEAAFLRASTTRRIQSLVSLIIVVLFLLSSTGVAGWFFFTRPASPTLVTTLDDSANGGSLRYCINNAPSGSTITFANGLKGTIKLTGGDLTFQSGKQLTLVGPGAKQLTISGRALNAIIHVSQKATVNISDLSFKDSQTIGKSFLFNEGTLTLTNSIISDNQNSGGGNGLGGGISNTSTGTLTVTNSTLSNNTVSSIGDNGGGGIFNAGKLTVTNSTLSNNMVSSQNGSGGGGGIYNAGKLTVTNSTILNNVVSSTSNLGVGGGIANLGTLTVIDSTLSNNAAKSQNDDGEGGGIYNLTAGQVVVTNSILSNNVASSTSNPSFGGGIFNNGKLTVTNSTILNNVVSSTSNLGVGGGIHNQGTLTISNSTFSNNTASSQNSNGEGGGIHNQGTLTVSNSTLSNNTASSQNSNGQGGGIMNTGKLVVLSSTLYGNTALSTNGANFGGGIASTSAGNDVTLGTSIVAANKAQQGPDISGALVSGGYNLLTNATGVNRLSNTDKKVTLDDLQINPTLRNNGGPTKTLALLPGSVAIDTVPLEACHITVTDAVSGNPMTITTDQRGDPRPDGSEQMCDVGAYESSY
jgi:energy-coupling factor transporter ATP-binding protein EcfA2